MNLKTIGLVFAIIVAVLAVIGTAIKLSNPPAEVQQVSLSAVQARLDAAREAGRPAVLYLYASSCTSCRASMKNLNIVVKRWGDDVAFVIVSVDEDPLELQALLDETGAAFDPLNVAAAPEERIKAMVTALGATYPETIPYGVVLDREGKATYEWAGARSMMAWEGAIEAVL